MKSTVTVTILGALASTGCVVGEITEAEQEVVEEARTITDDVVGVTLTVPADYAVQPDPALFDTYGFIVHAPPADGHDGEVARIALAYRAEAHQVDELVNQKLRQYADVAPTLTEVTLGDGRVATAVTGLPGTRPYSVVYTADGERVYEIGVWSSDADRIDDRARALLGSIELQEPARTVQSLNLAPAAEALYSDPPADYLESSRAASEERRALFEAAAEADVRFAQAAREENFDPPVPDPTPDGTIAASCGFTAPQSLYWQLQWDRTNRFYSGAWYNLRSQPGWSAMSGNYGSWWGANFHIWRCHAGVLNQWYANDWPAQYWANAYAAFSGYVEWAGWGTDGFASLGRYVVVRNGNYRSLTAHLTRISPGITWGKWINGYWTVIGYAGDTGESYAGANWAPHLHARVGWGERLTYNGQPYGGQSVRPRRLRCFACGNYDVNAPGAAGGWYTQFWHGRWMKY